MLKVYPIQDYQQCSPSIHIPATHIHTHNHHHCEASTCCGSDN